MRKIVLGLAALLLAGCGSSSGSDSGGQEKKVLTVQAAASLTESFGALEKRFEADHPEVDVRINFGGSSALAQQILNGAPADVFAAADEANMKKVTDQGRADGPATIFATNRLTIVVAAGNPKKITGFADLTRPDLLVVACAPQVPCGSAAKKVAEATKITPKLVSEEQDVKAVLTKVRAGEADAGLVYVTDVRSAGATVSAVDFPEAAGAVNSYPIAVLKDSKQADLARQWTDLVTGESGKAELAKVGFGTP